MFKKRLLIVILCFVVLLTGCGKDDSSTSASKSTNETSSQTKENKTEDKNTNKADDKKNTDDEEDIEDDHSNFEITDKMVTVSVPEGWKKGIDSSLMIQYSKKTASFIIINQGLGGLTMDQAIQTTKKVLEKKFEKIQLADNNQKVTVDEKNGKVIELTCETSNLTMKYRYIFVEANNTIYAITFADLKDTFDNNTKDFDAILKSIKF